MSHVITKVFDNTNIRITYAENGDVLFIAKDVAEALGYSRPRDAIAAHCKRGRRITAPSAGGDQEMVAIPESDVYRLVMRSKLESAEKFQDWVVETVLPAIRKTGSYSAPTSRRAMLQLMLAQEEMIEQKQKELEDKTNICNSHIEGCTASEIAENLSELYGTPVTNQQVNLWFLLNDFIRERVAGVGGAYEPAVNAIGYCAYREGYQIRWSKEVLRVFPVSADFFADVRAAKKVFRNS